MSQCIVAYLHHVEVHCVVVCSVISSEKRGAARYSTVQLLELCTIQCSAVQCRAVEQGVTIHFTDVNTDTGTERSTVIVLCCAVCYIPLQVVSVYKAV